MSCLPSLGGGSTGYSHLYLHSEEAVSMTLAHRTPDAGSAKVGGGALWIGIHVTLKTTRAISSLSLLSSLSFGPSVIRSTQIRRIRRRLQQRLAGHVRHRPG